MIPAFTISTYSSFAASNPIPFSEFFTFSITTPASIPALITICLSGADNALFTISTPSPSSPSNLKSSIAFAIWIKIVPPPGTIPSSTAAFVAFKASSILNFLSFISVSVAAPTFITATPPDNLASLSCNFSLS